MESIHTTVIEKPLLEDSEAIAFYASILSVAEIGLGGMLHALKVPLTGTLLSFNQVFILTYANTHTPCAKRTIGCSISCVSAVLKSLAPIGKKLTPMLAITMQGLLYSLGTIILGNTIAGRVLGSVFLSIWSFIQPIILYYFFFGKAIFQSLEMTCQKLFAALDMPHITMISLFAGCVFLKAFVSIIVAFISISISKARFGKYVDKVSYKALLTQFIEEGSQQKQSFAKACKCACKDLMSPFFIFSIILTSLFFWYQENSPYGILYVLRPIALCYVYFVIIRKLPYEKISSYYRSFFGSQFIDIVTKTINNIRSFFVS